MQKQASAKKNFVVRRQIETKSKQFGVYSTLNGKLHEGGFFTRESAIECAAGLEKLLAATY